MYLCVLHLLIFPLAQNDIASYINVFYFTFLDGMSAYMYVYFLTLLFDMLLAKRKIYSLWR